MHYDFGWFLYTYLCIISFMGGVLFLINLARLKWRGSAAYWYVMLSMFTISYMTGHSSYIRRFADIDKVYYTTYLDSYAWETRLVPLAIVLTVLVGHMYWRFFVTRSKLQ